MCVIFNNNGFPIFFNRFVLLSYLGRPKIPLKLYYACTVLTADIIKTIASYLLFGDNLWTKFLCIYIWTSFFAQIETSKETQKCVLFWKAARGSSSFEAIYTFLLFCLEIVHALLIGFSQNKLNTRMQT